MGGARLVKLVLPLWAAACQYPALPRLVGADDAGGSPGGPPDAAPDAFLALDAPGPDAMVPSPTGFVPLHVKPASLRFLAPDVVMNGGSIDTDALTLNGNTSPYFIRQDSYAILFAGVFAVQSSTAIHGGSPLIIVASGQVNINAPLDASAHADVPGPGASTTGTGHVGVSAFDPGPAMIRLSSGGGGGSHGSPGGVGGSPSSTVVPGGSSGATYGASPQDPLVGGSPGGIGGFATSGSGGGGGGALQISSGVSINVFSTRISVGGGGGVGGHGGLNGGAGGGAGGEILLEAPTISFQNSGALSLNALGGGGGAGGSQGSSVPGGDGVDANDGGAGGPAGVPHSGAGGAGATMLSDTLVDAQSGSGDGADGGGGGGGAGRIFLRYRATSPAPSPNAGPPAILDPTLP